MLVFPFQPKIV